MSFARSRARTLAVRTVDRGISAGRHSPSRCLSSAPVSSAQRARTGVSALSTARSDSQLAARMLASISRGYSTTSDPFERPPAPATGETVALDFEAFHPSDKSRSSVTVQAPGPIVVCHGLFGSKQNWRSLGRAMSSRFGVDVYALDLRNHGTSPHVDGLHYRDMARDVGRFLEERSLDNVVLIGHSMGGKVVMSAALDPSIGARIEKLVSVDMSPRRGPLSKEFEEYMDAMVEIEQAGCKTRHEADELLQKTEQDMGVRQFLLTNLTRNPPESPTWSWRIPVKTMQKHISSIGDFPYDVPGSEESQTGETRSWNGDVLFIKGSKSKYINRRNIPTNRAYFPNAKMVIMETGHWCQAEKPNEFVQVVEDLIKGQIRDQTEEASRPRT